MKGVRLDHTRPGTWDSVALTDVNAYRQLGVRSGDRVLDVGAHIGAFARLALDSGVGVCVTAVEPAPTNLTMLYRNLGSEPRVDIVPAALVSDPSVEEVELWMAGGKDTMNYSTEVKRGRMPRSVPAVSLSAVLAEWPPDVVKVDIEGGEYGFEWGSALPRSVRALAVELHLNQRGARGPEGRAAKLVAGIEDSGFEPIRKPRIGASNWTTVGVWTRTG